IGDGNPGTISGYDSLHYIITDNRVNGGFLFRENISRRDGLVVFPIGSKQNAYTPLAIRSKARKPDNYYVNVVDGIKIDSIRGDLVDNGVNKTWQVGKQLRPNLDVVDVILQHLNDDEGNYFRKNKSN